MTRVILLLIVTIAMLMIAPRSGYSGKVILKPEESDSTFWKGEEKDWFEESWDKADHEEASEQLKVRREELIEG